MFEQLINGISLGGVSVSIGNVCSLIMLGLMTASEKRAPFRLWSLVLWAALVMYGLLWALTLFRTPLGSAAGYGESSTAVGLVLAASWLWPASRINAGNSPDRAFGILGFAILALATIAIFSQEEIKALSLDLDYIQRLNYIASFYSFVAVPMILRGERKFGYAIALWNLINQALLLSKPGLLLIVLSGSLILASGGGKVNVRKLLLGIVIAVALVPVGINILGDTVAANQGYDSWDQFVDVRITRENYSMQDYRLFGVISDGGRLNIWIEYLTLLARDNVWIGTGYGLRDAVGVPDHNLLVFLASRSGMLGLLLVPLLFVAISRRSVQASKASGMLTVTLCLIAYAILCVLVSEIFLYPDAMAAIFFSIGAVSGWGRRVETPTAKPQELALASG